MLGVFTDIGTSPPKPPPLVELQRNPQGLRFFLPTNNALQHNIKDFARELQHRSSEEGLKSAGLGQIQLQSAAAGLIPQRPCSEHGTWGLRQHYNCAAGAGRCDGQGEVL